MNLVRKILRAISTHAKLGTCFRLNFRLAERFVSGRIKTVNGIASFRCVILN